MSSSQHNCAGIVNDANYVLYKEVMIMDAIIEITGEILHHNPCDVFGRPLFMGDGEMLPTAQLRELVSDYVSDYHFIEEGTGQQYYELDDNLIPEIIKMLSVRIVTPRQSLSRSDFFFYDVSGRRHCGIEWVSGHLYR